MPEPSIHPCSKDHVDKDHGDRKDHVGKDQTTTRTTGTHQGGVRVSRNIAPRVSQT